MYLQKQGTDLKKLKPMIWQRFIDDTFIIWTHGKDKLEDFLDYINKTHETIKFTAEYSTTEVAFLNTSLQTKWEFGNKSIPQKDR